MGRLVLYFRALDWLLIAVVFLLVAFGLVMLYSLTLNTTNPDYATFREQLLFAFVGLVLLLGMSCIDYRYYRSYSWALFLAGALLLLAVLIFGTEIRGAKSWFVLGPFSLQPVEIAKVCLVLFFAKYFTDHAHDILHLRHLLVSGAGFATYLLLVMLQPDLGSGMILLGLFLAMVVLVNVRRAHLAILVGLMILSAAFSWFFVLQDYQRNRILLVVDPSRDPLGQGYNVQQALVAIGSGKLFGRGLGLGPQSQLNFLPEQKTDFIFAAISEELGFVGASVLVGLFVLLLYRIFQIARRSRDQYASYLVFGIGIIIFTHMVINIGMNLGLMPVAGVPLPFLSAGGSSLITLLVAIGIVESVVVRERLGARRS